MMLLTKDSPEAEGTETHFDVDSRQNLWRTEHEEVLKNAEKVSQEFVALIKEIVKSVGENLPH